MSSVTSSTGASSAIPFAFSGMGASRLTKENFDIAFRGVGLHVRGLRAGAERDDAKPAGLQFGEDRPTACDLDVHEVRGVEVLDRAVFERLKIADHQRLFVP